MILKSRKILTVFIVFIVFLILYYLNYLKFFDNIANFILEKPSVALNNAAVQVNQKLKTTTKSKFELLQEIGNLQKKINDLNFQILKIKDIKKQNQELKSLLKFQQETNYQLIVAEIIHKDNLETEKLIVINKGTNQGIKEKQAVIIGQGTLIGQIIKTDTFKSTVRLSIDPKSNILATPADAKDQIAGIVKGSSNALFLDLVPKNIPLEIGQKIKTNGLQAGIPASLFLGKIIQVQKNPNQIFNSALIQPPYTLENLKTVSVIIQN